MPLSTMSESDNRRRSARLSSPPQAKSDNKMALASVAHKRSITVRKIAPRKTVAPSEHDKENTPRRPESENVEQKKPKVSTSGAGPGRKSSSSAEKKKQQQQQKKKKKAAMPSPILPSSPPPPSCSQQPDPEDLVWSQKARRSYSRLSDNSFNRPDSRETMFGFEKLSTPEVLKVGPPKTGLDVSGSVSGLNSFVSLLEAEDGGSALPEPDMNIPGVVVAKEKKRRKKIQQIDNTELDALAAVMNAEFEEAEEFELVVE
ncbi:sororin [Mugil cephalus]|uniref:sororin n=1 Tax=Mugil cephalus TaxID=48193 RepID=UPI001FB65916|nr:sororin [Mugil cephalus]